MSNDSRDLSEEYPAVDQLAQIATMVSEQEPVTDIVQYVLANRLLLEAHFEAINRITAVLDEKAESDFLV